MNGWIKLHRTLLEWEWFTDHNVLVVFIYLLLSANHKDTRWRGVDVERGQLVASLDSISTATELSVSQVRTALNKLKKSKNVTSETTNKFTLITIANYELFQGGDRGNDNQGDTQIANKSHTYRQQIATNNNDKNEENEKNKENYTKDSFVQTADADSDDTEPEKQKPKSKPKPKRVFESNSLPYQVAHYMVQEIYERLPGNTDVQPNKQEATTQRWADDIDKLIRIDLGGHVDKSVFSEVVTFSQGDDFWRKQILSGANFRKNYNKLLAKVGDRWD
jgi:hypothetical protein